jgi:hypothetical protein
VKAGPLVPAAGGGKDGPAALPGEAFVGRRGAKKLAELYGLIEEHERAVVGLALKTARAYFDAGAILARAAREFARRTTRLSARSIAELCGLPERRVALSLKIFKAWERNPEALRGLSLREAVRLIAPPPESGGDYNRVELGGDPGQGELDFGDLFKQPASANPALKNHRAMADYLTEIFVVSRTKDGGFISKRFARFMEDVPQDPALRSAYKAMAHKTQAAVEDYLAALEANEQGGIQWEGLS